MYINVGMLGKSVVKKTDGLMYTNVCDHNFTT